MRTCAFYTLGCKVNQYETQSIRECFARAGYREREFNKPCNVYVINTCTVTLKADKESRRLIREVHRRSPRAKVIVTGCYVELNESELRDMSGNHIIVRQRDKGKIVDIIASKMVLPQFIQSIDNKEYPPFDISDFKNRTKAFLKVQDGCNNFCSYCKVSLVRGRSRSRDMASALAEMRRLLAKGFKEIVLTGICLGAWGEDLSPRRSLSELLEELIKPEGGFRIRLSSIEPKYVNNRLISVMKSSRKLCRHLHIPFQSGDDEILKAMNRPYTVDEYLNIVEMARDNIPEISVTTDIMVGFPQETEVNFGNTCRFIEKAKPSRIHVFTYSKREGTSAFLLKAEVPKNMAKERLMRIKLLESKISYGYRKNFLQKVAEVLIEAERDEDTGLLKGYDDRYIKILMGGRDIYKSRIMPVRIESIDKNRTIGAILQN